MSVKGGRLSDLQQSFQLAVQGKLVEDSLLDVVRGPKQLSGQQGIEIYQRMYQIRIRDALLDDFAACASFLGEDFDSLCRDFIAANPSTTYTLSYVGRGFAEFILKWSQTHACPLWLSEVAQFEHAMAEALVAPVSPSIDAKWLASLAPEVLTQSQLILSHHVRLVTTLSDVTAFYEQYKDGLKLTAPARQSQYIMVYVTPRSARYEVLEPEGYALLSALQAGDTLEYAVEQVFPNAGPEDAQKVFQWLSSWMAKKVFCEVRSSTT